MKKDFGPRRNWTPGRAEVFSLGLLVMVAASCHHAQPATAAQAAPAPTTPAKAEMTPPAATPAPPASAGESVLAEDLATLNKRGYLKDAFFDFDKADLREDARTALAADAQWLKDYPSIRIVAEGHCDERGTEEYNLSLGQRRSAAVRDYLATLGIGSGRVQSISYGKDRPFCNDPDETCWQENRRGHFVITAK